MLSDMGASLDWFTDMALQKGWRVMKVNAGPGKNFFMGLHPDALKIMLRAGNHVAGSYRASGMTNE